MLIKNLKFDGYDTGSYGKLRADGLTLHFFSEDTSLQYYTIFNVNLSNQRGPNKGLKLSGKKFWITKRFAFYHFWRQTSGLPLPSRGLTTFHECMGKLNNLTFEAESNDGKRLIKQTLKPISSDNNLISFRQVSDKPPINVPDKHLEKTKADADFEEIFATCKTNYDISNHGKKDTRTSLLATNSSYTDNNSWLSECDELF